MYGVMDVWSDGMYGVMVMDGWVMMGWGEGVMGWMDGWME